MLPPDYHTHTLLCKHASGRPVDYARAAEARGHTAIACTDHNPVYDPFLPSVRMTPDQFELYMEWVDEARSAVSIPVLLGIEADWYEGCERWLPDWLDQHPFDLVLGSVHVLGYNRHAEPPERERSVQGCADTEEMWRLYFERIARMAATGFYDIVAHIDLPKREGRRPDPERLYELVAPALDAVAKAGMAIEINTSGWRHPAEEAYPSVEFLGWARERGIPITIGADAHTPDQVGLFFDRAVEAARDAGYTHRAEFTQRERKPVPL
jgi:histidinol-phosphatase (PHP family)